MKIIGFLIVGQNEANRYLPKVLERLLGICDEIVVGCNATDWDTRNLLTNFPKTKSYDLSQYEWGKEQWRIKQLLFDRAIIPRKPDWIICVDADEILDKRFTREKAEELAQREEVAYTFYCVQLWDKEDQMRVDGGWGNFRNVRYYKYLSGANPNFQRTPLHCGLAPMYAYKWSADSEFFFKHYGYLKEQDRKEKWERYQKYDPSMKYRSAEWYKSILGKPELKEFDEDTFGEKLKYRPKRVLLEKIINKTKKMKTYYIRNKYGKVYPVNEKLIEETLKRPGMTLLGEEEDMTEEVLTILKEPTEETQKQDEQFKCEICGVSFESSNKLRGHKLGKHRK